LGLSAPGYGATLLEGMTQTPDFSRLIGAVGAQRDRAAFAALFEFFAPRIKTYLVRAGASVSHADELAQETMLAVWRKADLFDPSRATASAWIFTIARNLRVDRMRKEWRDVTVGGDLPDVIDDSAAPDDDLSAVERAGRVRVAIGKLSEEQRKVIAISFFENKAHAEIAKTLGLPLGTVKSRLRLAMKRLRELLGELS
jgi:RNA polymerase sigma-70 factor, ECF subfamily